MFRLIAVGLALVLWFALACVVVPRIVPPLVDVWEHLDFGAPGLDERIGKLRAKAEGR